MSAETFPISESTAPLGHIAILWRGDEAARRSATADNSRFKAVFAALADVGVNAEPVVYEDDVLDAVRAQLTAVDGVLVWVNPIHEGCNRAILDALLREVAAAEAMRVELPARLAAGPRVVKRNRGNGGQSSVFPIPVEASAEIAHRVADRLRSKP